MDTWREMKKFVREVLRNNYWSCNLIGLYHFWGISPRNLTLFTGQFLTRRRTRIICSHMRKISSLFCELCSHKVRILVHAQPVSNFMNNHPENLSNLLQQQSIKFVYYIALFILYYIEHKPHPKMLVGGGQCCRFTLAQTLQSSVLYIGKMFVSRL